MVPREAKTFEQICKLKRDNVSTTEYWIEVDELVVTLCKQRLTNPPEERIDIPRKDFNTLVDWYNTGSKKPKRKNKGAKK